MDGDSANAAEDNLSFLCFNHHDDYDGTTRLAKGLREDEVRHWRDELYKEMEYRAEGMAPVLGKLAAAVPSNPEEMVPADLEDVVPPLLFPQGISATLPKPLALLVSWV